MEELAKAYQAERPGLESGDLTALVIRGLVRCAVQCAGVRGDVCDVSDVRDVNKEIPRELILTTSAITKATKEVAHDMEADLDDETLNSRRVGRTLRKMRWRSERTNKTRGWVINTVELRRLAQAYGVDWPEQLGATQAVPHPTNVTNVTNVITSPAAEGASHGNDGGIPSPANDREVFFL